MMLVGGWGEESVAWGWGAGVMGRQEERAAAGRVFSPPSACLSPGTTRPVRAQLALYYPKLMKQRGLRAGPSSSCWLRVKGKVGWGENAAEMVRDVPVAPGCS